MRMTWFYSWVVIILLAVLTGCTNYSQVSNVGEACFPDGSCTVVSTYMNGAIVAGKQVVVVNVKDCKKVDGNWRCTLGDKTVSIGDGMAEKMLSGSVVRTHHSGRPYAEGDNINSGSTSGSAADSSSNSRSNARARSRSGGNNHAGKGEH